MTTIHILVCACQPVEANNLSSQRNMFGLIHCMSEEKPYTNAMLQENPREY